MTEAGANVQPKPAGRPEHVKLTALLNDPEFGVTVTLTVPLPPGVRVTEDGVAPRLNVALPVAGGVLGGGVLGGVLAGQFKVNFTGPEI